MMTRPVRVTRDNVDVEPGLAAFCRGAGIDPQQLPPEARAAALQLAGQMLRESLLGLLELQQGRAELHNRLGVAAGGDEAQSPLNLSRGSVQDILTRLLSRTAMRAGSVDALRDKFRELKGQNAATLAAMQAALTELLARFSPVELEERFGRSARRGAVPPAGRERYWDLYCELYATLAQCAPEGFPHLFAETFARDFDARMSELAPPRRGSFGGE
jgi:type VI secretion system FHA domain protein